MSRPMTGSLGLRNEPDKKGMSPDLKLIMSDNLPIVAIVAAYIAILYAVHAFFGIHGKIVLIPYFDVFTRLAIVISGIFLIPQVLKKNCRVYFSPRYLAGFLTIFLLAPLFTSAFVSLKQTIPLIHGFSFDARLARLDRILHFGQDPWRLLSPILEHPWILRGIDALYMIWFLVLVSMCLWMAWTRRRRLRLCFFVSTLLIWILLGLGMATFLSSAGPCYYSKVVSTGGDPNKYGPENWSPSAKTWLTEMPESD